MELLKALEQWEIYIENIESPFMKILQLDELFFQKKVIKMEKGEKDKIDVRSSIKSFNELD